MKYQIYIDRGNGPELTGCWGSENGEFNSLDEAKTVCAQLHESYPGADWLVLDENKWEEYRLPAKVTDAIDNP